ncbi:CopG family transcriptional regulator [Dissulfurispira sp.]|uniref:ribbon-helix-helix domain-containing protein n=1 Tax=Dissulfurispira sp. TaxID=2817609 RepID=UPI002FD9A469
MVRTQIQLTEDQAEALKRLATTRHLSVAELIRQAIDKMIKSAVLVDIEERRRRAIEAAGRFSSGLKNLSEKHDEYFVEAIENK